MLILKWFGEIWVPPFLLVCFGGHGGKQQKYHRMYMLFVCDQVGWHFIVVHHLYHFLFHPFEWPIVAADVHSKVILSWPVRIIGHEWPHPLSELAEQWFPEGVTFDPSFGGCWLCPCWHVQWLLRQLHVILLIFLKLKYFYGTQLLNNLIQLVVRKHTFDITWSHWILVNWFLFSLQTISNMTAKRWHSRFLMSLGWRVLFYLVDWICSAFSFT